MKKVLIILCITIPLFLWWCTKKVEHPIVFDHYKITLATKYAYQETAANSIIWGPIIKQYLQENETWFAGSIIIAKSLIETGIDINKFATTNSKSLTRKIPGAEISSTDEFSFPCKNTPIKWVLQKIKIQQGEEKEYLNQMFFTDSGYLYGMSTMTTDKTENKNLSKSIKKISCPWSTQE